MADNLSNKLPNKDQNLGDGCSEPSDSTGQPKLRLDQQVGSLNVSLPSGLTTASAIGRNHLVTTPDTSVAASTASVNIQLPVNMQQPLDLNDSDQPTEESQYGPVKAIPVDNVKSWHRLVSYDVRTRLVHKFVQEIFSAPALPVMDEEAIQCIITHAKSVENQAYELANSHLEYFYLLAAQIYQLKEALNEKSKT